MKALFAWLDDRFGLGEGWGRALATPMVRGPSWGRAFVAAFVACFVLAGLSGAGLSFSYSPSAASAWASVWALENLLPGGFYLRSLHVLAADGSVIFGVLAVLLLALERRYQDGRDLSFLSTSLVVGLSLAFCMTGNVLRWDNRGYFGFLVEANVIAGTPGGALTKGVLLGGSQLGNWTLTRLHALHVVVLPAVALALGWAAWRTGRRASLAAQERGVATEPYLRRQVERDLLLAAIGIVAIAFLAWKMRAPLESPADPLAAYDARPEWYFQSLFVARNLFPPTLQGFFATAVPPVVVGALVALPFFDRDPAGPNGKRGALLAWLFLPALAAVGLTFFGLHRDDRDEALQKARAKDAAVTKRALQVARADGIPPAGALAMIRTDPVLHGEELFTENCAGCHRLGELGPPAGKETAPTLDGWGTKAWAAAILATPDAPQLFGRTGYKEKMPSFVLPPSDPTAAANFKPMAPDDLDAIAAFLANEAEDKDRAAVTKGRDLVSRRCTTCHLLDGKSDDEGGFAPELAHWASPAWTKAQIANPGTNVTYRAGAMSADIKGHMPKYAGKLTDDDIDLLARFVSERARRLPFRK